MSDEQAFLNALTANPADDVGRLAYSDWLEERGELAKATYLRLVVRAVGQVLSKEELGMNRDELWPLISELDEQWRYDVGVRFDLRLESYEPQMKIATIKLLRVSSGASLADAKRQSEAALPHHMTGGCRLEDLLDLSSRISFPGIKTSIQLVNQRAPMQSPLESLRQLYRIVIELNPHENDEQEEMAAMFSDYETHTSAFRAFLDEVEQNVKIESRSRSFSLAAYLPGAAPLWIVTPECERIRAIADQYTWPSNYSLSVSVRNALPRNRSL